MLPQQAQVGVNIDLLETMKCTESQCLSRYLISMFPFSRRVCRHGGRDAGLVGATYAKDWNTNAFQRVAVVLCLVPHAGGACVAKCHIHKICLNTYFQLLSTFSDQMFPFPECMVLVCFRGI